MDVAAKKFTNVTDFNGMDSWPMWAKDGFIYFVSDREGGGLSNIWRVADKGGVTALNRSRPSRQATCDGRRSAPTARSSSSSTTSASGSSTSPAGSASPHRARHRRRDAGQHVRSPHLQLRSRRLQPRSKRTADCALGVRRGVSPRRLKQGDLGPAHRRRRARSSAGVLARRQAPGATCRTPAAARRFTLRRPTAPGTATKISDVDALKLGDVVVARLEVDRLRVVGQQAAAVRSRDRSRPPSSRPRKLRQHRRAGVVARRQVDRLQPAGLRAHERRLPDRVDGRRGAEGHVRFLQRLVTALRAERPQALLHSRRRLRRTWRRRWRTSQIYAIALEREDRDPEEPVERPEGAAEQSAEPRGSPGRRAGRSRDDRLGWACKRRTRQITRMPFSISDYSVAPDSRSLAFVTTEPSGTRTIPVLYTIQQDGRRLTRVLAGGGAGGDGDDDAPAGGGRGGGGLSDLAFTRDGRTLYFREGRGVYAATVAQGGAAAGGGAAGVPRLRRWPRDRAPPRQLHASCAHRSRRAVEADVRRCVADDEVPLLRSEDARPRLGRDEGEVRAARRSTSATGRSCSTSSTR